MARLGDISDRKRLYTIGVVIFAAGAGLAGAAWSLPSLTFFKVLQGVGSAMIQGNAMAMVLSVFPASERGKALGTNVSVVGAGAICGPSLGGFLVSQWSWRATFFVSMPLMVMIAVLGLLLLDSQRVNADQRDKTRFDSIGAALGGALLLSFLLVVGNGHRLGWESPLILGGIVFFLAVLAGFIWWELRTPSPMLELRLFKRRLVAFGIAAAWFGFIAMNSIIFLMPFYLQKVLGYSPREAGLIIIPGAAMFALGGPIVGRLSDRYGWRPFVFAGQILILSALLLMAMFITPTSSLAVVIPLLLLQYGGQAIFNTPNNSSIISAVERSRYGVVSALTQLTRNSANVTSVALSTTIVATVMGSQGYPPSLDAVQTGSGEGVLGAFVDGMHFVFYAYAALILIAISFSFMKGKSVKEPEPALVQAFPQGAQEVSAPAGGGNRPP
jgi:EmrB/QacA subfamily drug resistance transporter